MNEFGGDICVVRGVHFGYVVEERLKWTLMEFSWRV